MTEDPGWSSRKRCRFDMVRKIRGDVRQVAGNVRTINQGDSMQRWIIGVCLIAASACQVTETSSVEQAASVCSPGSYPNAKLPKMGTWYPGQWKPTAGVGQVWVDHA